MVETHIGSKPSAVSWFDSEKSTPITMVSYFLKYFSYIRISLTESLDYCFGLDSSHILEYNSIGILIWISVIDNKFQPNYTCDGVEILILLNELC